MHAACQVTDLTRYRMTRQRPITDACRWSAAFETVTLTHVRLFFAWQRLWLRALTGV